MGKACRGPAGARVAQIGRAGSGVRRIAKAVAEIRANLAQPLSIGALAKLALTSMSPLQYQKALLLQEARRLMLSQAVDARTASRAVGYLSAPQFSREYARFFGAAPAKDIARLREKPPAAWQLQKADDCPSCGRQSASR